MGRVYSLDGHQTTMLLNVCRRLWKDEENRIYEEVKRREKERRNERGSLERAD